jgi:predicted dehydrogenase
VNANLLNVGIIGLGKMGKLHLMNCLHIDGVKVTATADFSEKALGMAKSLGVRSLYTDYHTLLEEEEDLDALIISLPNFLHFESIRLALRRGLNIFTEKPLANTLLECHQIVRSVQKSGVKFMVGHNMRFFQAVEQMKTTVEQGHIGKPEVITIEEVMNGPFHPHVIPSPVPEWWFDPKKTGGGVMLDLGYHLLDLFRFLVGDAEILFSCTEHKYNLPVEDSAILVLDSPESSVKGMINVGWYQISVFPKYNFRLIIHGNSGYLSSEDVAPKSIPMHAVKEGLKNALRRLAGRKIHPLSYTYYYESYYKELEHFFGCIKDDSDPIVSAIDGLETIRLIQEAYENAAKRSTSNAL